MEMVHLFLSAENENNVRVTNICFKS